MTSASKALPALKTFRIWFLLLLAVLLPIRGAVAGAMLCPAGSAGLQSELRLDAHAAHHDHGAPSHHDEHDHGVADKCNMCTAFCSLTPLLSDTPKLPEPLALPAVRFPDISSPAPSFLSDGQERPPRTH